MSNVRHTFDQLREKAEALIGDGSPVSLKIPPEEMAKILHELQVHQIELELQNENLRKTQDQLAISRDRFALLFHQAPVGYLILNPNGIILEANDTFCRMIGMEADRIVSRGLNEFLTEEDRKAFLARYRSFYNSPTGKHMEFSLQTRHQDLVWVRMNGARMNTSPRLPSGTEEESGILVTLIDITDRILSQKTIDLHRAQLQTILDILQYPVTDLQSFLQFVIDKSVFITESRYGILMHRWDGQPQLTTIWSQQTGDDCRVSAPPMYLTLHADGILMEVIERKEPLILNDVTSRIGSRIRLPEGHVSVTRLLCLPILRNDDVLAVAVLAGKETDYRSVDLLQVNLILEQAWKVIDRETALMQVRKQEELYRTLTENSQDCIMRFDERCRHIFVNSASLRMTQLKQEDFLGKTHREMGFPSDLCDFWESSIQAVFSEKRIQEREFSWDGPHGRIVFDWRLFPEMDDHGNVVSVVSVARDITKWRKAEEERDRMQLQIIQQQKMESIGRLAGGIAHDFNNKLQAILGYTDMAIEDAGDNDALVADLQTIRNISMNLADLVRQLLGYASKQLVCPRILDLNQTISGMTAMLRRLIGEHIFLDWAPTPELWQVKIDPGQVDQILMHLCLNARDALREGGTITIRVENVTLHPADCAGYTDRVPGDYVATRVSDTGEGIDAAILEHIFEPFFTSKDIDKGKGLGLAVIYGIVRQNGGFVEVESRVQQGTTFRIFLPRCMESDEPAKLSKVCCHSKATILMVEDDPDILDIGRKILERMGYAALIAQDPQEALARAESILPGRIDLLITDVVMPEMNGKTLSDQLSQKFPGMRTIFMSGYTADILGVHGILEDRVLFLQKPFTVNAFMMRVAHALKTADESATSKEGRS
ncbi:MAG: PAS domain S-box protein [Thermodesulfobacteriota bacterium]